MQTFEEIHAVIDKYPVLNDFIEGNKIYDIDWLLEKIWNSAHNLKK